MKYRLPKTCEKILFYIYENEKLPINRWEPLTAKAIGAKYDDFIQACAFLETIGMLKLHYLYTMLCAHKYIHCEVISWGARDYISKVKPELTQKKLPDKEDFMEFFGSDERRYDLEVFPLYDRIARDIAIAKGDRMPGYLVFDKSGRLVDEI